MNREFSEVNNSLPEQLYEQCKTHFEQGQQNLDLGPLPLRLLPHFLQKLKLQIPESMMKDYLKYLQQQQDPQMNFKQFTHYVSRASLEEEVEDQFKNLFYVIDRQQSGTINAQDLWIFIKELDNGNIFNQKDIDNLMLELDQKQMGFLGYEDFVYGLLPK